MGEPAGRPALLTTADVRVDFEPLRVGVRPDRDRVFLAPAGEIDMATVELVRARFEELRAVGWRRIVIDLREVSFMDSTGLGLLVRINQECDAHGIDFSIVDGPPAVARVLEVSGVSPLLRRARRDRER